MKTFITSDLHLGHKGIMRFCPLTRGHFQDVDHMNEWMIQEWNKTVQPGDLVYILGDVAFCSGSDAAVMLARMNGDKILIEGNHDNKNLKDPSFRRAFREIHKYLEINHNGTKVCMFHFPILEWNQCHRGSVHFYGHLHQNASGMEQYRARNVGWDCTGQLVSTLDEMVTDALKGQIAKHHGD
jgi:calcineurin-like phosphoesterase family protein